MSDEHASDDTELAQEKFTRRGIFKFAARVGVGLVAFVPAAAVLLQDTPAAYAARSAGPDYIPCQMGETCYGMPCGGDQYAWVDSRETNYVCCCTTSCGYHPPNC
jgi:hypothetical protein